METIYTRPVIEAHEIVKIDGPIVYRLDKIANKTILSEKIKDLAHDKWEAMMMISKCIEHTMKYEKKLKKHKDDMTLEEQFYIKEKFYKKYLEKMGDERALRLINLIDSMVLRGEYGGAYNENVPVS